MEYELDGDLVSKICLGLTSRRFYSIFRGVIDRRRPNSTFDLRMQVSDDDNHWCLYGSYEYGIVMGEPSLSWHRSLFELTQHEKTLWADLRFCEWCVRYEPIEAFGSFELEEKVREENPKGLREMKISRQNSRVWTVSEDGKSMSPEYFEYGLMCRRCRASLILTECEGRMEILGIPWQVWEDRESMGLIRRGRESEYQSVQGAFDNYRWAPWPDMDAVEPWNEVFNEMGI